jgi:hypothetical protein
MSGEFFELTFFMGLTGLGWFIAIKKTKKKFTIPFTFLAISQVVYSSYFIYNLTYNSNGGMSLVWGLYFIFFNIGLTFLLSIIGLIYHFKKSD